MTTLTSRLNTMMVMIFVLLVSSAAFTACELEEAGRPVDNSSPGTATLMPYTASVRGVSVQYPDYATGDLGANYEFAVKHPEVLMFIPCYCGCGSSVEHNSNLDCFIKGVDSEKNIVFSDHARNCAICQVIASETERLFKEGSPLKDIRAYIDETYGQNGPGTDTPLPPE